ncbi:MAG: YkgJ family cysteine cluster protein [Nitrospirae bacterium]|nr:YkgJ family cysteine cluster protein [Nitrospirota bacterium]MBF0591776.1 YkgJ family cysteine cluster protein [Nitrospirota bacterium]
MEIVTPFNQQQECIRRGQCCMRGSATLHVADADLIINATVKYSDLFTIREGELVYNNLDDEFVTIDYELIKINEKKGTRTCSFFEEDGSVCTIYEHRPAQCRAYECWNTEGFVSTFNEEKLTREHLLAGNDTLLDIVRTHEDRCSYAMLAELVGMIRDGSDVVAEVFDALSYDEALRSLLTEKLGIAPSFMPLILGRPLADTIIMFGYKVETDQEGNNCLVVL